MSYKLQKFNLVLFGVLFLLTSSGCKEDEEPGLTEPPPPKAQTPVDSLVVLGYPFWSKDGTEIIGTRNSPYWDGSKIVRVPAGSNRVELIYEDSLEKRILTLSSDGKKIVYLAAPVGRVWCCSHVWVIDIDGTHAKDLTPEGGNWEHMRWSPDSRFVVFSGTVLDSGEFHEQIVIADVGTGKWRLLTRGRFNNYDPTYLADGSKIVYESTRIQTTYGGKVFLMDPDGSDPVPVDISGTASEDPLPSPTRNEVLFHWGMGNEDDRGSFVIDIDSVHLPMDPMRYRMIHRENFCNAARWSPDGNSLLFLAATMQSDADLYIMDRNGGNIIRVTHNLEISLYGRAWSPDSRKIIFLAYKAPTEELNNYIYDLDKNTLTKLILYTK